MATYTSNLDLIKPAGTDKIRIAQINENMDTLDAAIGAVGNTSLQTQVSGNTAAIANVQNGLAYIVGNTNTTGGTLAVGQFVYVKGHSTISEGLRKVTASISANASITTSNTDACSEGGLNALNSKIAKIFRLIYDSSATYGGAGSMQVDLSNHTAVFITVRTTDQDGTISSGIIPVGRTGRVWDAENEYYRDFTVTTTGISWTASNHPYYPNARATPQKMYAI